MFLAGTKFAPSLRPSRRDAEILQHTRQKVEQTVQASPRLLNERIAELSHEWDMGRSIAAILGVLVVAGSILALVSPWWLILSGLAGTALLSFGIFGWCPLVPVM